MHVHVCVCVFVHLCVHVCVWVFVHLCVCVFVHLCVFVFVYVWVSEWVCMCVCTYIDMIHAHVPRWVKKKIYRALFLNWKTLVRPLGVKLHTYVMHMYICVYMHIWVHGFVCICIFLYTECTQWIWICVYMYTCICIFVCMQCIWICVYSVYVNFCTWSVRSGFCIWCVGLFGVKVRTYVCMHACVYLRTFLFF